MFDKEFYKMYPNLEDCSIQLFYDDKWGWWQILPYSRENLMKSMELQKKNKWVFFSVNSMEEWKRDKSSVTNYNAWVCEIDDKDKETQMDMIINSPVDPSIIIESKKSYHMYRLCDWEMTAEEWVEISLWLCEYFWWDTQVSKNISAVLRLPWFKHLKNPKDPFDVHCISIHDIKYRKELMKESFPYSWIYNTQHKNPINNTWTYSDKWWVDWDSSIVRFAKTRPAKEILIQLSGTRMLWWDQITFASNTNWTEQIVCNWKSTGNWIDNNLMIGSSEWWWPTWVNRVRWYHNKTSDEMEHFIYDHFKDRLDDKTISRYEKKWDIKKTIKEKIKEKEIKKEKAIEKVEWIWDTSPVEIKHEAKMAITRWLECLDKDLKRLTLQDFVVFVAYPQMGKSLFWLLMAEENWKRWFKSTFFSLELSKQVFFERTAVESAWIDWNDYLDKNYDEAKEQMIDKKINELNNMINVNLVWCNTSLDIDMLLWWIRKFHAEWSDIFYIDNLGKIIWSPWEHENSRFENITSRLQDIMKELNICIILMHHLWKPPKWDEYTPWWGSAFRWTQKIKDNCTCMVEIWYNRKEDVSDEVRSTVQLIQYKRTRAWWSDRIWLCKFQDWKYIDEKYYRRTPSNKLKEDMWEYF